MLGGKIMKEISKLVLLLFLLLSSVKVNASSFYVGYESTREIVDEFIIDNLIFIPIYLLVLFVVIYFIVAIFEEKRV